MDGSRGRWNSSDEDAPGEAQQEATGRPRWWAALAESARRHRKVLDERGPSGLVDHYLFGGRAWWETTVAVVVVASAVLIVIGLVGGSLMAIADGAGFVVGSAVEALTSRGIPQTIYDPVKAYLNSHSEGLPITAEALAGLWLTAEGGLLVMAFFGSWGARVGWTLVGALTVAMVWAGTIPHGSRWTAAGVAVTAWSVLSIAAFQGAFKHPRVVVAPIPTPREDPEKP